MFSCCQAVLAAETDVTAADTTVAELWDKLWDMTLRYVPTLAETV